MRAIGVRAPADSQMPRYGRYPSDHVAEKTADKWLEPTNLYWGDDIFGCVGLFYWKEPGHGQHFGIFSRDGERDMMIQAYYSLGKVTESGISNFWKKRLMKIYRVPGVTYT